MTKGHKSSSPDAEQQLPLDAAASHVLEECRMVLPGIQALFGFQLIAVLSAGFSEKLSPGEQRFHLLAIVLVVMSIALVMTPAALHRQREPRSVSNRFIEVSSHLLLWSMVPLGIGICAEVYLVAHVILRSTTAAGALAGGLLVIILGLWFGLPRRRRL
jgi:Family of unknown function (DUF6328)